MVFLHRWKFFSKNGNNLNLKRKQKIEVIIDDISGRNAKLQPITDIFGNLIFIEIIDGGINYSSPTILLKDTITGTTHTITNITLGNNGEITAIDLGNPIALSWSYPSFVYYGDIYFNEKIPTQLIENEHIFIIEEVKDLNNLNKIKYTYPRCNNNNGKIKWKWTEEKTEDPDKQALFLFDVETESNLMPFINKIEEIDFQLDNGINDLTTTDCFLYRKIDETNNNSIQLNIGISYNSEGIFERYLELYDYTIEDNPALLAKIKIVGEVIPEDERFITILENIGQRINKEDEFIFRDSDINEDLPNVKLLNEKRKEFILEHSNIISYIGSYKGLFNVINWLGYNDLRLKEYFLNIDENSINYNKYKPIEISHKNNNYHLIENLLSTKQYKKTNLFGLFYDINKETDEIDEFGIPETEDVFLFTIEEILIKLFALKKYLKEKFLPLNARIIDIVGEGIYFEKYNINSWFDGTKIFEYNLTRDIDFECLPKEVNIIDLRYLENYDYFQPAILKCSIDYNNPLKPIHSVIIEDPGYGYLQPNNGFIELIFEGGNPVIPAQGYVTLNSVGGIDSVVITNYGEGYVYAPKISLNPTPKNPVLGNNISQLKNIFLGFFDGIENLKYFPDEPNIPVGAPVTLKTSMFDITWDEMQYQWDKFYFDFKPAIAEVIISGGQIVGFNIIDPGQGYQTNPNVIIEGGSPVSQAIVTATISGGQVIDLQIVDPGNGYIAKPVIKFVGGAPISDLNTWDTIGIGDFYEMQWIINGPNGYQYKIRDRIDVLKEHRVILPYIGNYDVELIVYDTDNNWINRINKSCIKVKLPEIDFTGFCQYTQNYSIWDDLNFNWNKANFMWINPVKHNVVWDDLKLAWDDLDLISYKNYENDIFIEKTKNIVKRISETDRFFGKLISVNPNTNELKIANPPNRPPLETGDYIYLRQDDTIFRTEINNIIYEYSININIINSGSYTIVYDPQSNPMIFVVGTWNIPQQTHPVIIIDPPTNPNGTQATAVAIINGSISNFILHNQGAGYFYLQNGSIADPIMEFPSYNYIVYNVIFDNPYDPNGLTAGGPGLFDAISGSFIGWFNGDVNNPGTTNLPLALGAPFNTNGIGSGYNNPPINIHIFDANGNLVTNEFYSNPIDIVFSVAITGSISNINIINPGSGYTTNPNITIEPIVSNPAILDININGIPTQAILNTNSLPLGINNSWEVLREIGRTILLKGNQNEINSGDWITLQGKDDIPKLKRIEILNAITNNFGINLGIIVNGNRTDWTIGEKCSIYKVRKIQYGQIPNFKVNDNQGIYEENKITIYNPTFNLLDELIPGYHEILLKNWNSATNTFDYTQRVLIIHIQQINNNYILTVEPIDGNLNLFNNNEFSEIEYEFHKFPAVIDEIILNNNNTSNIILNFNDWPEHETFDPNIDTWYIDYGIVSGEYSFKVLNVGIEDNNTLIKVDDYKSELWQCSTSFLCEHRQFDKNYAKKRFGFKNFIWNDLDEIFWEDIQHLTWNMSEYYQYNYCSFKINKVALNGRIQWNEESVFEFTTISPNVPVSQQILQAVEELNNTDNKGLSRFQYIAMPNETNPNYIIAIAKSPGGDNLGYLRFLNGVEGEYLSDPTLSHTYPLNNTNNPIWLSGYYGSNNNPPKWNFLSRTYYEYGTDPGGINGWYPADELPKIYDSNQYNWKSQRTPYLFPLGGSFTWSETFVSSKNFEIPIYTTVCFTVTNCKIAGKTEYIWKIINESNKQILIETKKPKLIWNFTQTGNFTIELEIKDSNGNKQFKKRNGFIKTYKSSKKIL